MLDNFEKGSEHYRLFFNFLYFQVIKICTFKLKSVFPYLGSKSEQNTEKYGGCTGLCLLHKSFRFKSFICRNINYLLSLLVAVIFRALSENVRGGIIFFSFILDLISSGDKLASLLNLSKSGRSIYNQNYSD